MENIAPKGAFLSELASRNWVNAFENKEAKLAELAKGLAHLVKTGARDESVLPFDRSGAGQSPAATKWLRKPVLIATAAITLIATSATATWLLWPERKWTVESSRPFVSTLALEGDPAFSSDGKMLAYTSGSDPQSHKIYVHNVAGGDAIKVTNDAYNDVSPAWSPDGTRLAHVATKPGEPPPHHGHRGSGRGGAASQALRLCGNPPRSLGSPALRFFITPTRRRQSGTVGRQREPAPRSCCGLPASSHDLNLSSGKS